MSYRYWCPNKHGKCVRCERDLNKWKFICDRCNKVFTREQMETINNMKPSKYKKVSA